MRSTLLKVALIAACVASSGCYKIYFHKQGTIVSSANTPNEEWHHGGILGLVEFSEPVSVPAACGQSDWSYVETYGSFVTGLVTAVTGSWYSPRMAKVGCGR